MSAAPTKKEVAAAIVRAGSPDEIESARKLRDAYLLEYPDDTDILDMGETLNLLEQVLRPKPRRTAGTPGSYNDVIEPKQ